MQFKTDEHIEANTKLRVAAELHQLHDQPALPSQVYMIGANAELMYARKAVARAALLNNVAPTDRHLEILRAACLNLDRKQAARDRADKLLLSQ